jgi:iron complex transport system ATP-binding protein
MSDLLLHAADVTGGYPDRPRVLNGCTIRLGRGDFAAIIGPNGTGKTTLFRALSGFLPHWTGSITLDGKDLRSISSSDRARRMAVVPQDVFTPLPYSVREVVEMGRTCRMSRWRAPGREDCAAVDRALAAMAATDLASRPFNRLSGGERQRVMVAMALADEPDFLLLDEPTSHLDLGHAAHLLELLAARNRETGLTILLISHDVQTVARWCRHLFLFHQGAVIAEGAPREVLTAERLGRLYGRPIQVAHEPVTGALVIIPGVGAP